ncbi:MAG: Stk1 family PASTA domain-containing Ser/Thr kinase [Clostridia bacterium]
MDIIGKVLGGRYEIIEKVGEGGMAVVYKAKCNLLNRYVAIKVLKSEYASDDIFVKKFRAEAQSAASLTHPNIVSVYDVGQEGEINYIVMELLESKTLKDYIEEKGAIGNELTLKIGAQIASALEAAHKSHIIHRDIKPHNIVLNKNMVAKVTDFGIAKITNTTSATITSLGSTVGSVHYFSPEHAKGGYTDEKSDIYSLGIVMYEMATGKLPFDGDSPVAVAIKQIQEEATPPIELNSKISPALNQIILKAMMKSTAERYQNATEILADISKALENPNTMLACAPILGDSVEAGATQVIPTISDEDLEEIPNIRTRQARKMAVVSASKVDDDEAEDEDLELDEEDEKPKLSKKELEAKKKKKQKIIIICCIVGAVILIGLGIFFGVKSNNRKKAEAEANKEVDAPNLVGRVFSEVVEEYSKQGIEILQDKTEYSNDQPEGSIISQTPEKGQKTKNKKIYVVVSKGQKMVDVPNVVGKDSKVAQYELEDTLGFKVIINEVISSKVAAGVIISQNPKSGEKKSSGSDITLTVSKGDGKASVIMPSVLGKEQADAKRALEVLTFKVLVKYGEDSSKPNGVVIAQNYPQNQELKEGALVEITVNKVLKTKTVNIDLIELQGGKPLLQDEITVRVTASIDGGATNTVYQKTVPPTQKTATFEINGYKSAEIKVYLNGNLSKSTTIEL